MWETVNHDVDLTITNIQKSLYKYWLSNSLGSKFTLQMIMWDKVMCEMCVSTVTATQTILTKASDTTHGLWDKALCSNYSLSFTLHNNHTAYNTRSHTVKSPKPIKFFVCHIHASLNAHSTTNSPRHLSEAVLKLDSSYWQHNSRFTGYYSRLELCSLNVHNLLRRFYF